MVRSLLIVALALSVLSCGQAPQGKADAREAEPVKPRASTPPAARDSEPNLAKGIKIERVWLEKGKAANGIPSWFLALRWRNNTGRPIRLVWVNATITDKKQNTLREWDDTSWDLFDADQNRGKAPVEAAVPRTVRIWICPVRLAEMEDTVPSKARARVIAAYETDAHAEEEMQGTWEPPGYKSPF